MHLTARVELIKVVELSPFKPLEIVADMADELVVDAADNLQQAATSRRADAMAYSRKDTAKNISKIKEDALKMLSTPLPHIFARLVANIEFDSFLSNCFIYINLFLRAYRQEQLEQREGLERIKRLYFTSIKHQQDDDTQNNTSTPQQQLPKLPTLSSGLATSTTDEECDLKTLQAHRHEAMLKLGSQYSLLLLRYGATTTKLPVERQLYEHFYDFIGEFFRLCSPASDWHLVQQHTNQLFRSELGVKTQSKPKNGKSHRKNHVHPQLDSTIHYDTIEASINAHTSILHQSENSISNILQQRTSFAVSVVDSNVNRSSASTRAKSTNQSINQSYNISSSSVVDQDIEQRHSIHSLTSNRQKSSPIDVIPSTTSNEPLNATPIDASRISNKPLRGRARTNKFSLRNVIHARSPLIAQIMPTSHDQAVKVLSKSRVIIRKSTQRRLILPTTETIDQNNSESSAQLQSTTTINNNNLDGGWITQTHPHPSTFKRRPNRNGLIPIAFMNTSNNNTTHRLSNKVHSLSDSMTDSTSHEINPSSRQPQGSTNANKFINRIGALQLVDYDSTTDKITDDTNSIFNDWDKIDDKE